MAKSPDAFRTISEVAEWLDTQAHVLRFWESKFTQVKPVKRAGGRRYYRPQDMLLLGGIKTLLHDDGMTIKGAQKLLREKGVKYVSGLSQPLDGEESTTEEMDAVGKMAEPIRTEVAEADYLPENDAVQMADDDLPEVVSMSDEDDDLPELDAEDLRQIATADASFETDLDDNIEESPELASEQSQGGASDLFAHAQDTLHSGTPDGSDDDNVTPSQDTIPALINRVSEQTLRSGDETQGDSAAAVIDEPEDRVPIPETAADDTTAERCPSPPSPYLREAFMQQLAHTTHIAPQHRAKAARLVAELTALRAHAGECGTT